MLIILLLLSTVISSSLGNNLMQIPRIVGGFEMDISQAPYIVSVHIEMSHVCSGIFIHKNWILTVAHGFLYYEKLCYIRAGSSKPDSGGIVVKVEKFITHPNYDNDEAAYDYSLLKLRDWNDEGIVYKAIPLPENDLKIPNGALMLVAGYGALTSEGNGSKPLRGVYVYKSSREQCMQNYRNVVNVTDQMLCAGHPLGGKDACLGDSGGPLVLNGVLAGIVTYGHNCGLAEYPGIYGRISIIRDWIKEISGV